MKSVSRIAGGIKVQWSLQACGLQCNRKRISGSVVKLKKMFRNWE